MHTEEGNPDGDIVESALYWPTNRRHFLEIHRTRQEIHSGVLAAGEFHGHGQSVGDDMQILVATQGLGQMARDAVLHRKDHAGGDHQQDAAQVVFCIGHVMLS